MGRTGVTWLGGERAQIAVIPRHRRKWRGLAGERPQEYRIKDKKRKGDARRGRRRLPLFRGNKYRTCHGLIFWICLMPSWKILSGVGGFPLSQGQD